MDSNLTAELEARLAELQVIFHQQLPGKVDELQAVWRALSEQWTTDNLSQLHRMCHSLAGSAGTFGAHEISQQARTLEHRLKQLAGETGETSTATQQQLTQQIEALTQSAKNWRSG
jgi:HPt (histidine-containing phosphotransfer) domain-containing protein